MNKKVQNLSAVLGTTSISGNLLLTGTPGIPDTPATITGNIIFNNSIAFTDTGGWSGNFVPVKSLTGDIGTPVQPFKNLNLSGKINGNTPFGGVAMIRSSNNLQLTNNHGSIIVNNNTSIQVKFL